MVVPLLIVALVVVIGRAAWPAISTHGLELVVGTEWNVARKTFGAVPAIVGTIVSSLLALLIATPLAIGAAIYVSELAPRAMRGPLAFFIDLLSAIPSVVYGLWGVFVLVPFLRTTLMPVLSRTTGASFLRGPAYGPSLLAASLILAIMIVPYITAVAREVLAAVPRSQREAALALGATRWEMIRDAVVPYARSGIVGGVMLGLGRALGETLAVAMVIGSRNEVPHSLFDPAYTLASLLVNEFADASDDEHLAALMAVAGLLLLITLVVNVIARWLVGRVRQVSGSLAAPPR